MLTLLAKHGKPVRLANTLTELFQLTGVLHCFGWLLDWLTFHRSTRGDFAVKARDAENGTAFQLRLENKKRARLPRGARP